MPLRGNPLSPSGRRRRRGGLSGPSRQVVFGRTRAVHGILTSGRATDWDAALAGERRGQGPGDKPQESWRCREVPSTRAFGKALKRRASRLP
jgi:hypothetical protein